MQPAHTADIEWVHALKRRILVGILALVALSIGLAMIFIVVTLRSSLLQDSAMQTQQLGDVVKATLKVMMLRRDPAVLQQTLDAMSTGSDSLVGAFIIDAKGTIAYATDRSQVGRVLDRNREESCIVCHRTLAAAPTAHSIIVKTAAGVHAQRNVNNIYNEPACYGCHSSASRINGKLVIDRSMNDVYSLIATIEVIIVGSGIGCLALLVPFLSRRINTYVDGMVSKNTELTLLLTISEHLSRTIEIEELRRLIVDIVRETFDADSIEIVHPHEGHDCRIYRWSKASGLLERARLQDDEASGPVIERWMNKALETVETTFDGKRICLPITKGGTRMALLTIGRTTRPFEADRLALTTVISSFLSMSFENARLYSIAISDELTSLYTVRHFHHCLEKEVSQAERFGEKTSLVMLDIDNFKRINDTFGHAVGDSVLREVAQAIGQSIRDNDLAFRYGGEEFAVLLRRTESKGGTFVAERIRAAVEAHVFEDATHQLSVTVSVGLSTFPDHAASISGMMLAADQALYAAKHAGKNRVMVAPLPLAPDAAGPCEPSSRG